MTQHIDNSDNKYLLYVIKNNNIILNNKGSAYSVLLITGYTEYVWAE